jgi:hypothetical protein
MVFLANAQADLQEARRRFYCDFQKLAEIEM